MEEIKTPEIMQIENTRIDIPNRTIYWHGDLNEKISSASLSKNEEWCLYGKELLELNIATEMITC